MTPTMAEASKGIPLTGGGFEVSRETAPADVKRSPLLNHVAVGLWIIILALITIDLILISETRSVPYEDWGFRGFQAYLAIPLAILGFVIVRRFPRNWIGWLFLGSSISGLLMEISVGYAYLSLVLQPETFPGGDWASWLSGWLWLPGAVGFLFYVMLLFPDGRLPSPRWKPVAWFMTIAFIVLIIIIGVAPGPVTGPGEPLNPLRSPSLEPWSEQVFFVAMILVTLPGFLAVASLFFRFRRSSQQVRQQLKWFIFASIFAPFAVIVGQFEEALADILLVAVTLPSLIAIALAILRYRLYEIDIIIRKTLIYGLLTGVLVFLYFIGVVLLQALFRSLTGQSSSLAIVLTTLAITAMFNPLRQRFQSLIDLRFYRHKYDAQQALDTFVSAARKELDLTQLTEELTGVVTDSLKPQFISIWLQPQQIGGEQSLSQGTRQTSAMRLQPLHSKDTSHSEVE
jgi:hypothetical protein